MMLKYETIETDLLVIGGGIAGLYAAVQAVLQKQRVVILIKGPTCSWGIVGFNVPFRHSPSGDSPAVFFDDLMAGGKYLNDTSLIALMCREAESVVRELEKFGVVFQKDNAEFAVRRAAGSSKPRTVYHGDSIGPDIMGCFMKYLESNDATFLKNSNCISLLKENDKVVGAATVSGKGELNVISSKATILATGGAGSLYSFSTTPESIDGDGYRIAFEAGAVLTDMEFVQFEPFIFVAPPELKGFSTPTTSIWDGAKLYNIDKQEFLPKDSKGTVLNLTKDVLSRYIHSQVSAGKGTKAGGVYMDWTGLPHEVISKYPRFVKKCKSRGIDPYEVPMEVAPACHHMMGGVIIDSCCRSTVPGLFAAGEVTSGVHGANRLAGAAGTDVLVFGRRAGEQAALYASQSDLIPSNTFNLVTKNFFGQLEPRIDPGGQMPDFEETVSRIKAIMWDKVGLVRNEARLQEAIHQLSKLYESVAECKINGVESLRSYYKAKSATFVSLVIAQSALMRQESRGDHYREDFLERDDLNWLKHIVVSASTKNEIEVTFRGIRAQQPQTWGDVR